ncbi:Ppx/GppA family phosphatase [Oxynema sp. CENA135]|uniref:Ppx/GppA phosphatase family protein n=1 Tax=Oxynema sp. CENA135 TaxID=984206 RepID=UPI00190D5245|nr:Ppx/GppA phosphatase family protein [Oxynema sp. CENA135]MBK4728332.1 Ppx/GppA family phosphatase [Oxynema sp. CENA135]
MIKSVPVMRIPAPSAEKQRTLAAIDMGTNSLHMVVVRIDPTLPTFTIIAREKETVRLGDREVKTGNLKPEIMKGAIAAMQRFCEIATVLNAEQVVAVATSAVREAPNGKDFLKLLEKEVGVRVNLIPGQEEARRIYLGVLSGMDFNQEPHVIIDIGGGSTELILGDGQEPRSLSSTKVGAVRLTSEFVSTDPISSQEFKYLQAYIRGMMERPVEELQAHLKPGERPRLVGTSGTIETLAEIHARETLGTEPSVLTGYEMSLDDLRGIISRLRKMSEEERADVPGMSERRSEIIVAGALILQETMAMLGVESIAICERALREGTIVDWMLTHGLIEDRLRFQSSIRQRSTMKIARKYQVDLDSSERIAAFALSLFDQTRDRLHEWGLEERELLWTAAILHNCGVHVNHSSHHKHSYYLIRNSELLGYTETEIEIIANLARYHRKSAPKKKHDNYSNLPSKQERKLVSQLSALLRLAVALDRRSIGAIAQVKCEYDKQKQEVCLKLHPTDPGDECALELWSLEQKKEVFEQEYEVKLVVELIKTPMGVR